jgi:hypothetical protein
MSSTTSDDQGRPWRVYAGRDGRVFIERATGERRPFGFAAADLIDAVAAAVAQDETAVWA